MLTDSRKYILVLIIGGLLVLPGCLSRVFNWDKNSQTREIEEPLISQPIEEIEEGEDLDVSDNLDDGLLIDIADNSETVGESIYKSFSISFKLQVNRSNQETTEIIENSSEYKLASELLNKLNNGSLTWEQVKTSYDLKDKKVTQSSDPSMFDAVYNSDKVELINDLEGHHLVKKKGQSTGEVRMKLHHILICFEGTLSCSNGLTRDDSLSQIRSLLSDLTIANFAEKAKQYSTDPSAQHAHGDLGWIEIGETVKSFEDAAVALDVDEISGVVETDFGFHIIYKEDEVANEFIDVEYLLFETKDKTSTQLQWQDTGLNERLIERAELVFSGSEPYVPMVAITFNEEGARLFSEITRNNTGRHLGVFINDKLVSLPKVQSEIANGQAVIGGQMSIEEAKDLAERINTEISSG